MASDRVREEMFKLIKQVRTKRLKGLRKPAAEETKDAAADEGGGEDEAQSAELAAALESITGE